jgi:uncharacterized membrane protein YdjX (TVP38/TMEM64 family)
MLSGLLAFAVGRRRTRIFQSILESDRAQEIRNLLKKKGAYVVFLLRLLPLLPFSAMNFIMGASNVSYRDFAIGSFFGLLPGILAVAIFEEKLRAAIADPNLVSLGILLAFVVIFFVVQKVLGRMAERRS